MAATDTKTRVVRSLRGGQMTIPAAFREQLGISEETLLQVTLADGELRIKPLQPAQSSQGSPWFQELYEMFAPVREYNRRYSDEEIDAAIDEAVQAVRSERRAHRS